MNVNDLTIGEAKELLALFSAAPAATPAVILPAQPLTEHQGLNHFVGKKCIVRTYAAGVWFGEVAEKSGSEVILKNARRMWRWHAAESISLSAVAIHGINQNKSKITEAVDAVWLEVIELIPATPQSIASIEGAEIVKAE